MPPPKLWSCVEGLPGLAGVPCDWQKMVGADFAQVKRYLWPTDQLATTIPCRVGCTPCCRRRAVRHGPGDVVAICDEGDPKYAVDELDLLIYQLNLGAVCRDLCGALAVEPAVEQVAGLHQTWRCGFLKSRQGTRHPVYLSIQMEDQHLVEVALRLSTMNRTQRILLLPTTRRISELVRHILESNQTLWTPLDRTVGWSAEGRMIADVNLAELLASSCPPENATNAQPTEQVTIGNRITIERREMDDGVHWIVNGVDKGKLYTRTNTIRAWILDTLYEGIGRGWIEHALFIKHLQWKEVEYFGKTSAGGLMQKQLYHLRRDLGVHINFKKEHGVRFADGIIQER